MIDFDRMSVQLAVSLDDAAAISDEYHAATCGAVLNGLAASLIARLGPEQAAMFIYRWADSAATLYPAALVLPPRRPPPVAPQRSKVQRAKRILVDIAVVSGVPLALLAGLLIEWHS